MKRTRPKQAGSARSLDRWQLTMRLYAATLRRMALGCDKLAAAIGRAERR